VNAAMVDKIVNAVLYEGYMLYPYRPSAVKNRQRFNFGVVYPRTYSEAGRGTDSWRMQTQCLVVGNEQTRCNVRVRFLRMVRRSIFQSLTPSRELSAIEQENVRAVEMLEVDGKTFSAWQEAIEESIEVNEFSPADLAGRSLQQHFRLPAAQEREAIRDEAGLIVGVMRRDKLSIEGTIELQSEQLDQGLFKLTARILNESKLDSIDPVTRDAALSRSLVSAHTILEARAGEFVSLIDPPDAYREFVGTCQNVGTWPVLVGQEGRRDTLLSSPIILYDYPEIAPESPGDLFDGAEIDEILSLRIMTMTDEEKREMRDSDERARKILERTETMPEEQFMKLHGALRGLRSVRGEAP
jgi:hypothetical protein